MYICLYVCVSIYVSLCMYMYGYLYVHVCTRLCVHPCVCVLTFAHAHMLKLVFSFRTHNGFVRCLPLSCMSFPAVQPLHCKENIISLPILSYILTCLDTPYYETLFTIYSSSFFYKKYVFFLKDPVFPLFPLYPPPTEFSQLFQAERVNPFLL